MDETGRRVKTGKGNMLLSLSKSSMIKMLQIMMRWMPRIAKGRRRSLSDLSCYFRELYHFNRISAGHRWSESYPNKEIWDDIADYAYSKWKCKSGFTHVPKELIFKDWGILFEHAIVVIREMDKNKIDQAPAADAGEEAYRVYAVLGEAVNDIANRLRTVHQIKCQSHHPPGGLVNDSALASKEVLRRIRKAGAANLLDIGCGNGNILLALADSGVSMWGIDLSEKMIDVAKKRLKGKAGLTVGDAHQLPYPDSSMDYIVCNMSFHHYPQPGTVLKEMRRVLTPEGTLLIGDPNPPLPMRLFINFTSKFSSSGDYKMYSKKEFEELLRMCGWKIIDWVKPTVLTCIFEAKKVT